MKAYKLKHILTGLYYQPHKHGGSNLSKKGKIYQTATNGLSSTKRSKKDDFRVQCEKDSIIHKLTKDKLNWETCTWARNQLVANTKIEDWIEEQL